MKQKTILLKRCVALMLVLALSITTGISTPGRSAAGAEKGQEASRTILMYVCGADLEARYGIVSKSLNKMMEAAIPDDVNILILTGGAMSWDKSLYIDGATEVSTQYNQVWKMTGAGAGKDHGVMSLVEAKGIDGANHLSMEDPAMLKAFLNYAADNFPAKTYDLILLDHGMGPAVGINVDTVVGRSDGKKNLSLPEIANAISTSSIKHFDFIDFYTCLMGSTEVAMALSPYTDYFIGSSDTLPGAGEDLKGWLDLLSRKPESTGWELGKQMVDDTVAYYNKTENKGDGEATLSVINTKNLIKRLAPLLKEFADILYRDATTKGTVNGVYNFIDEFESADSSIRFGGEILQMYDLGTFVDNMGIGYNELVNSTEEEKKDFISPYTDISGKILEVLADCDNSGDDVIYHKASDGEEKTIESRIVRNSKGEIKVEDEYVFRPSGLSIYFDAKATDSSYMLSSRYSDAIDAILGLGDLSNEAKEFLSAYRKAVMRYSLIVQSGKLVVPAVCAGKSNITFDMLQKAWNSNPSLKTWTETILRGAGDGVQEWLSDIIKQQEKQAVTPGKIQVKSVEDEKTAGSVKGYQVRFSDISVGDLRTVRMRLLASLNTVTGAAVTLSDKAVSGEVSNDFIAEKTARAKDVLDAARLILLSDHTSFDIKCFDNKWYTLKAADGHSYAISTQTPPDRNGYMMIPVTLKATSEDVTGVLKVQFDKKNPEKGTVIGFIPGNKNYADAKSGLPDLNHLGMINLSNKVFDGSSIRLIENGYKNNIETQTEISPDIKLDNSANRGLSVELKDISEITDIQKNPDGTPAIAEEYYFEDPYGNELDLTETISKLTPSDMLKNMAYTEMKGLKTTDGGKTFTASVTYKGEKLTEGTDYGIYCAGSYPNGTMVVVIYGMGDYSGVSFKEYTPAKKANTIKLAGKSLKKARTFKVKQSAVAKKAKKFKITRNGKGAITWKNMTSGKRKKFITLKKNKIVLKKNAPKGTYRFTLTVAADGKWKKTTGKTVRIKVA